MTQRVDKDSLQLNQPRRTPSHPTKSHIVKTKVDGKEKIIRFGEQGASTAGKPKEGESDRMKAKRASFKSRHAKNIAKGPSSPAYWANKVKWADGGFVRTNYAEGDSVRTQPQNATLGAIANFLKQTYSPRRTQQLQGTMEFLGVPALARTTERLSYGQPVTNVKKANVPLLPDDTAEAAMLVAPPLASLAKRVGTNLVQTAPYVARDIIESTTSPLRSYAVKPKGGNWQPPQGSRDSVTMSVNPIKRNPEVISGDLINRAAGEDLWSKMVDENVYQYPIPWLRENRPDVLNKLVGEERGAVNKWLDSKLEKYIRNEMGTPEDPIRLAHEQGYSHIPGNMADELGAWLPEDVAAMRVKAGYPEEGFAVRKHAEAGFPEASEANARKAEMWENLADTEITSQPAGALMESFRLVEQFGDKSSGNKALLRMKKDNPWIEKLDRDAPIYRIDSPMNLNENLGFNHMADEIQNMLDPESGLPAALRMTPQQLDKVTMKQMVEKVDAVNKWRSEEASKAELGDMMGNLTATARLEVPDAQLSFVKEPGMKWIDIPATTDESAMKLCTTIGRQAGWCTQGEGLAKRYGSGDNSLTTLIDAEGRPHAQAMLGKPNQSSYDAWFNKYKDTPEVDEFLNWEGQPKVTGSLDKRYLAWVKETGRQPEQVSQDILELKPVENAFNSERAREYTKRDPDYKEKITDSVLDFLKSGSWGDVKDLHHYDIIDAKNPSAVKKFISENYGGDFGMVDANTIQKDFMKNYNGERFIKAEQFSDLVNDYIPKADGYAEGGMVGTPLTDYDPMQVDQIMNSIDAPRNYAEGGSVDTPDLEFNDDPEAMRLYRHAMKQTTPNPEEVVSNFGTGVRARVAGGDLSAGLDMNRMTQGERDQLMKMLAANYNINLGDLNLNARVEKPLDAKDVYVGMLNGSIPLAGGRAMLGAQGLKTPQGEQVLGYNAGWSGRVGPGTLNVNVNKPKRGSRSAQVQYQMPFAEGGSVSAYDPSRVDAIVNQFM